MLMIFSVSAYSRKTSEKDHPMKRLISLRLAVALSVVVVICGGAIAVNAATRSTSKSTSYYACLRGGTLSKVGLRRSRCPRGSTLINWNATGPRGSTGAQGITGLVGPAGSNGAAGASGHAGPAGPSGPAGPAGPAGSAGPTGPAGSVGVPGASGPAGPTGALGAPGDAGPAGATGTGYGDTTSNATITLATGSLTFTGVADTGAYVVGQRVRVIATSSPTNYAEGDITALSADESITVNVDTVEGSGPFTGWTFAVAGDLGATGPAGASGENCSATPYPGIDLAGCNFSFQILTGVNFTDADLAGADFSNAELNNTNFTGADLAEATFAGTYVNGTTFLYTNLTAADFSGAEIPIDTEFGGANLQNTDFAETFFAGSVNSGGDYGTPLLPNGWYVSTVATVEGEIIFTSGGEWSASNEFEICALDPSYPSCP
jgi:hypothetical protein